MPLIRLSICSLQMTIRPDRLRDLSRFLILTGGPPRVGCPVIAAIGGVDGVLLVTEPTVFGIHDMQRVVELSAHFHVPVVICVNKWDLNLDMTAKIESYAREQGLSLAGNIPFDPIFTTSMVTGQTIFSST